MKKNLKWYFLNILTTVVIVLTLFLIFNKKEKNKPVVSEKSAENKFSQELTAKDIAKTLGLNYWNVKIPEALDPNMAIVFYVQKGSEKPKTQGHMWSRHYPNEFKITTLMNTSGQMALTYLGLKLTFPKKSIFPNLNGKMFLKIGKFIKPREIFMKFSSKRAISGGSKLEDWEYGFFYDFVHKDKVLSQ